MLRERERESERERERERERELIVTKILVYFMCCTFPLDVVALCYLFYVG